MGSVLGVLFRVTTWGESHGPAVGAVIDGCPAKLALDEIDIQKELDRRRPGQSNLTTPRAESDRAEILSGVFAGQTLGTPISLLIRNQDKRSEDYRDLKDLYRPSHADLTYEKKFGVRDWRGGGRASARETVGRVAAGAIAKKLLADLFGVEIIAYTKAIGTICADVDETTVTSIDVESNAVRCPDGTNATAMIDAIQRARDDKDSLGGIVECVARGAPTGWGEPVFDKIEADLAKAMLSIPASKAFEIGSGFAGTRLKGSEHNDQFVPVGGEIRTATNRSGGVQGGITNSEPVVLRVGFKPTATIGKEQQTVNKAGKVATIAAAGRHDPCVIPRAVPIVEAMTALVLVDHALRHRGQTGTRDLGPGGF